MPSDIHIQQRSGRKVQPLTPNLLADNAIHFAIPPSSDVFAA